MATAYQERKIPDPVMNVGDEPYFEAAAQGKLLVKKCSDCNAIHHHPRGICPFCFSDKVVYEEAKGTGRIYTYSISRRVGPMPYCIAYVTLDEGVTMMSNIVDCDLDTVRIGQAVKVTFKTSVGGITVPMFTPV